MIKSLLLSMSLLSISAFANTHLETVCKDASLQDPSRPEYFYANPPIFEQDLIVRRNPFSGAWLMETIHGDLMTTFDVPVSKIIKTDSSILALAPFDIIEMNHQGEIQNIHNFEPSENPSWRALSMVKVHDMLVISRGPAGMIGFDMKTKTVKWQNLMGGSNDGFPSGLAFNGMSVYAAVATSHENGFAGIISVDPMNGQILKRARYTRASGVLDTEVYARMYNGNLVINNGGWIHLITQKQIEAEKDFRPRWVAHVIPTAGEVTQHYMMNNGDFFFEGNELVGCGNFTTMVDQRFARRSKLFKVKMP